MITTTQRFIANSGGSMVKFCEEGIVYSFIKSSDPYIIPYGDIIKINVTSWGLKIETYSSNNPSIHIDERKRLKQAVNAIKDKVADPRYHSRNHLSLTDNDLKFYEIASKYKRGKALTQEEKEYICDEVEPLEETAKRNRRITIMGFVILIVLVAFFAGILIAVTSSNSDDKSEWSELSEEEKDQIRDNMEFYEDLKDAAGNDN